MFKACILDGNNLIPKILPHAFKSVEYIEGNGEPGSIRKKVEALDKENFVYITEGDALMNKLEKITYETKLEASPDGGSICKTTCMQRKGIGIFKAIEAYLLANPNAY
ncbi:hypothetical protein E1A91_D02G070600v1 [Gossypium mustelinum]|uniref:Bet v I/Major latex protein domain-containing protein n=1 Tax=Gossypium mustelinum TaxID=34275 RepID=A0A5D2VSK9_GOSMU|nr:hypothetical protein E1A91_D02G070600v1 [Gossypium mustelinum]